MVVVDLDRSCSSGRRRQPAGCTNHTGQIMASLSPQQIAMGPAAGRVLQWLGALLLCAEPFVMLCQVLQLVLLQREPATSLGPPCQAVPSWFLPRRP